MRRSSQFRHMSRTRRKTRGKPFTRNRRTNRKRYQIYHNSKSRNKILERDAEYYFDKIYKKWRKSIVNINGKITKVPAFFIEIEKVKANPYNPKLLSHNFNKLAIKTFNTDLIERNPRQYLMNCIRLYAIMTVLKSKFDSRSKFIPRPMPKV